MPEPTFFSIHELIHNCAEDENPLLQDRNLELDIDLPDETLVLFADREMMAQAVRNVLGNAIKFASKRIEIKASAENLSPQMGGTLVLTIADDGGGIPPDKLPSIFEKYSKADPGASGTGLGLYITQQVMNLHHGEVSAVSEPGRETRFTFRVPLLYRPGDLPDLGDLAQEPVAIVSSSRQTASLLEGILSEAGMVGVSTLVADTPEIEELEKNHPRLVVADLNQELSNLSHLSQLIPKLPPGVGWLLHGPEQLTQDFLKTAAEPHPCLSSPVDPLMFLRMAAMLLRGGEVDKSATSS